jgi:hypothetical protein
MKRKMNITQSFGARGTVKKYMALLLAISMIFIMSFPASATNKYVSSAQVRQMVVDRMKSMANIEWIAGSGLAGFTEGDKYKGIPYSKSYNTTYGDFLRNLDSQGRLNVNCGIDCSTAALYAWKEAGALSSSYSYSALGKNNTQNMIQLATNGSDTDEIKVVGNYTFGYKSDTLFARTISLATYTAWLKSSKPGDVLVHHDGSAAAASGHAVVVKEVRADYILYIDIGQGASPTKWSEGKMYYSTLKSLGYIPITTTNLICGTNDDNTNDGIRYRTQVQDIGWLDFVAGVYTSGTIGESKRVEAIRIELTNLLGGVKYCTHVQDIGWTDYVYDGATSGTVGQSKRVEAIRIQLTGYAHDTYDVYYRVHVQDVGWMGWAQNGQAAGTVGFGRRVEAIQIILVIKGNAAPGSTEGAYIQA